MLIKIELFVCFLLMIFLFVLYKLNKISYTYAQFVYFVISQIHESCNIFNVSCYYT